MKKFLIKISYTLLPVLLIALGGVTYFSLALAPEFTGDIGRLAMIPFGQEYDTELEKSNKMHEEIFTTITDVHELKNIKADVLTIGDSFSERGIYGYQNYLSAHGVKVVNCDRYMYYNPVSYAYEVMDLGYIDSTNTDVLVVQVVERLFEGFMEDFNPRKQLPTIPTKNAKRKKKSPNTWSLSRWRDYLMYRMGRVSMPVSHVELDAGFFSGNDSSSLYIYREDIAATGIKNENRIKEVYRTLLDKANEKHIHLILMVAVDKLDLYQHHITDNTFTLKTVNEDIYRILEGDPHLLLTKDCLVPLIERGEKDIFLYNDSHWSYKAAEVVGDKLYDMISKGP